MAKGETLVIRAGERVENAVAFQGDLVVEGDAVVQKAVAIGGTLTLRPGAQVKEDAVAIGGDVRLEGDARVGKDAISLGGQVRQSAGSRVRGSVVGPGPPGRGLLAGEGDPEGRRGRGLPDRDEGRDRRVALDGGGMCSRIRRP